MYDALIKIVNNIKINKKTGCWEWQGSPRENGYMRTTYKGKSWYVHRLSISAFKRIIISSNLDVCHICDNRICCNPEHLFVGTRKDNMMDAVIKNRHATRDKLPQTKIKTKQIKQIINRINKGDLYKDIAKDYNVIRQTIGKIAIKNGIRRRGKSNDK